MGLDRAGAGVGLDRAGAGVVDRAGAGVVGPPRVVSLDRAGAGPYAEPSRSDPLLFSVRAGAVVVVRNALVLSTRTVAFVVTRTSDFVVVGARFGAGAGAHTEQSK